MLLPLEFFPAALEQLGLGRPNPPSDWLLAIASLVFLGAIGTGAAIWLFNRLIISHGPLFAGMVTHVFPIIALAWGAFDEEQITGRQMAAMAGVLMMVALVQFGATRPAAPAPTEKAAAASEPCIP
jgi:drug/metabolite transporter (DMT)-like permease